MVIGQHVADAWSLPIQVSSCLTDHHLSEVPETEQYDVVHVVRVVSGLNEMSFNAQHRSQLEQEIASSAKVLGVDYYRLRTLATEVREADERARMIAIN